MRHNSRNKSTCTCMGKGGEGARSRTSQSPRASGGGGVRRASPRKCTCMDVIKQHHMQLDEARKGWCATL